MKKLLFSLLLALYFQQGISQVIITGYNSNPLGSNSGLAGTYLSTVTGSDVHLGGFEYMQFMATQDIDFSVTPYAVVTNNNAGAAQTITPGYLTSGWETGGARTYQFSLTQGTVQKGQFFYVGGIEKRIGGAGAGVKSTDISDGKGNPYVGFPETFENAPAEFQNVYNAGNYTVGLSTGEWTGNLGGIRNEGVDRKIGAYAWRSAQNNTADALLSMNFDVTNGVSKVTVAYGIFGTDAACTWALEYSVDGGITWTQTGNLITEKPSVVVSSNTVYDRLRTVTFLMNIDGQVRFRINKKGLPSGDRGRLNIDNFMIYDNLPKTDNVGKWIRAKAYASEPGDNGLGDAKGSLTILSPSGGTAGFAIFSGTTVTESSVPIDAVFMNNVGTAFANANIYDPLNEKGPRVPNNDLYNNTEYPFIGQGTNTTILLPSGTDGEFAKLGGVYDLETNKWTTPRAVNNILLAVNSPLSTIETNDITVLPVRLTTFTVKLQNNQVKLNWATASEKDNSHFNIQRSVDGKEFISIGTVQGRGNSVLSNTYNFTDLNPLQGVNYYRLEQVDYDGKKSNSRTVFITTDIDKTALSVYTENSELIYMNIYTAKNSKGDVLFFNMSGKQVFSQNVNLERGYNSLKIPVNLQNGVYIATLITSSEKVSIKFIK